MGPFKEIQGTPIGTFPWLQPSHFLSSRTESQLLTSLWTLKKLPHDQIPREVGALYSEFPVPSSLDISLSLSLHFNLSKSSPSFSSLPPGNLP